MPKKNVIRTSSKQAKIDAKVMKNKKLPAAARKAAASSLSNRRKTTGR